MSHTPGPWHISKCPCGSSACTKWMVDAPSVTGMFEEADARLIVAAPKLLEALKLARVIVKGASDRCANPETAILHTVDAAIAEAEGR